MWRSSVANRNQRVGTEFETLVLQGFRLAYPEAVRLGKQGAMDKGDIWLPGAPYVVECKREKSLNLGGWMGEAEAEAANAGKPIGVVVHKRRGKGDWRDQWVTVKLGDFLELTNAQATVPSP
jgi:hypothetical protein